MILEEKLKQLQEKIKQNPLTSLTILIAVLLLLLIVIPYLQVGYRGINNATQEATLENQYRATFAQILGGVAIGIGLYYTWRRVTIAENDLKVSQEGQITERFTRAVDQLGAIDQFGNKALEIRLGGIYALERISNESEKDYWPIMEILTAYVRMNSSIDSSVNGNIQAIEPISMDIQANEFTKKENSKVRKIPLDIQAILTVIGRRKASSNFGEADRLGLQKTLDLQRTYLRKANLFMANLNAANLEEANLEEAHLEGTYLKDADLFEANLAGATLLMANLENAALIGANLQEADLRNAYLSGAMFLRADFKYAFLFEANLKNAHLKEANLEGASLYKANLEGANLKDANLLEANLEGANLKGAKNLTIDQLSKVETLYNAKLDEELEKPLKEKYPALFEEPKR